MTKLPTVAVVGRPNVGKSTLFNRILKKKIAVVDDRPGVTRDRNYMEAEWNGSHFTIIDTGGMVPESKEKMEREINRQVNIAVNEADVVLFLAAADVEPSDLDCEIAVRLRKQCSDKLILAVNKTESPSAEITMHSYWNLGLGEPIGVSALHGKGVGDMLDKIIEKVNAVEKKKDEINYAVKIAVVGRPNSGKSSLVNKILGDKRVIVSEIAGTTRDSIDTSFDFNGNLIKLIDTAGLRKKARVNDDVEYYSNLRALGSIARCNIAVLLVDTARKLSEQDMKIVAHIISERKGLIICWNKWDIIEKDGKTFDTLVKTSRESYKDLENIPMISISALTGQRVVDIVRLSLKIKERSQFIVPKSELEDKFFSWTRRNPHPYIVGEAVRFLGIKQQEDEYPHFIIFCTNPNRVTQDYARYLKNRIYDVFEFEGLFVVLDFKSPGRSGAKTREEFESDS
ncbi:MAG: ribosome biogenesis GTPase Der [Chitinispirillales bacterium]|jgi:GTP-binding protein|nr:ribosome biogenesis GTPase Der [Chitinispirillales bacterium]